MRTTGLVVTALVWSVLACFLQTAYAQDDRAALPPLIKVCDVEWPPYAFHKRDDGGVEGEVAGYSVDFLKAILSSANIKAEIHLLPQKRCEHLVDTGAYDLLLDESFNLDRAQRFLITVPYYQLTDVYITLTDKPVPAITTPRDFHSLNVCGEMGFNYRNFGVPDEEIDTSYQSFEAAMKKLASGYCDVVLARSEIAAGQTFIGGTNYVADPKYQVHTLPYAAPAPFHMMASRNTPYARALADLLNDGIDRLHRSGAAARLMEPYRK